MRQFFSLIVAAFGLWSPAFAGQDLDALRAKAEQGDANAQFNLGFMYHQGLGVPRDYVTAYMWISLAAARGDEFAQRNLDSLASDLTADQLAEAQKMARDWQPSSAARQ